MKYYTLGYSISILQRRNRVSDKNLIKKHIYNICVTCITVPELLNVSIRGIRLFSCILLNKKIDVNSIYKVNRRIRLILTFKSSVP